MSKTGTLYCFGTSSGAARKYTVSVTKPASSDAAATKLVSTLASKAPNAAGYAVVLGVLWFGGPSNQKVLPRHSHGPNPQAVNGRLIIEGVDMLRAVDCYTGTVLWEWEHKSFGQKYNYSVNKIPGAMLYGSNYVSMPDGIYVITPDKCLRLDGATGKVSKEFKMPSIGGGTPKNFGFLLAYKDYLIVTAQPVGTGEVGEDKGRPKVTTNKIVSKAASAATFWKDVPYAGQSMHIIVFDRKTGEVKWTRSAEQSFRHQAIVIGDDTLFCIDGRPYALKKLRGRKDLAASIVKGVQKLPDGSRTLHALNMADGEVKWETDKNNVGTFLGYSEYGHVLYQSGLRARNCSPDEAVRGLTFYDGLTGKVLSEDLDHLNHQKTPFILHRNFIDSILANKPYTRLDPISGTQIPFEVTRQYGCNHKIGSEHLVTFRSAAAGYYDMISNVGTGNLAGFKSGCSSNLIPAEGILNAPDYTRTCICAYPNQSSLAFIHMPEMENWSFSSYETAPESIKKLGLNFRAPGDRLSDDGVLWLECPFNTSPTPLIPITVQVPLSEPKTVEYKTRRGTKKKTVIEDLSGYFRKYSTLVKGESLKWVGSSGMTRIEKVSVTLDPNATYKLRFVFLEPDATTKPGDRIFTITVNGKPVLENLDVVKEAGAANTVLIRSIATPVKTTGTPLFIEFKAVKGDTMISGIEFIRQ
jgi:hypothetical protein